MPSTAAYEEAHRSYHSLHHLEEVFLAIDVIMHSKPIGGDDVDMDTLLLGAWFRDLVYNPHASISDPKGWKSDEELSALLALQELTALPEDLMPRKRAEEVARLVRMTQRHDPLSKDTSSAILCDADLAILAASDDRYDEYVKGIQDEYIPVVGDKVFTKGRMNVLKSFLEKEHIYHTESGKSLWEVKARRNIIREMKGNQNQIDIQGKLNDLKIQQDDVLCG
jgi:predicted metal-dependent HD superfamily phosphohydrolase